MLEFGMPTLIENKTLEENIALCKSLGLSFIELNMNFPEYQIDQMEKVELFFKKADETGEIMAHDEKVWYGKGKNANREERVWQI